MNIALISNEYPPNVRAGLGRYAERITKYFLQEGHQLWVFTANPGNLPDKEGNVPLTVYRPARRWLSKLMLSERINRSRIVEILLILFNLFFYSLDSFLLLRKLNKRIKFDVIAVHDTTSSPLSGILLALTTRVPVVFHVHSVETTMTPWAIVKDPLKIIAALERLLAHLSKRIVVPSVEQIDFLTDHGWDAKKITVIPHGYEDKICLNVNELPSDLVNAKVAELRERLLIAPGQPVLLFVGRLVAVKGIHTLIRAMKPVVSKIPNAKLVILGEGKGKGKDAKVESLIRKLDLEQNVYAYHRFLDSQEVMWHTILADICIFPSLYEPFGLVAIEAMSLGKAVILGYGFPRIFSGDDPDKPTAVFVERDDPDLLASEIINLLHNPDRRQSMGKAAKKFIKKTFSWEKTVAQTIKVYEGAIREND